MNIVEWEHYERQLYVKAYLAGHSVLSIGRALGFSNMDRVYRALREYNAVKKLPKRQRFNLPVELDATFRKCKLSFAQWCNSWRIDLKVAEQAIYLGHWEVTTPHHRKVLDALKSDFHNLYMRLYQTGNIYDMKWPEDRGYGPRLNLVVEWSEEENFYVARIPTIHDYVGVGESWDTAIMGLKRRYNLHRRIRKIQELINNPP